MSPAIEKLSEALAKAQAEIKEAALDKENPHFHNPYATLASVWEACRKPLSDNGLSVTQVIGTLEGKSVLRTVLMHSSGQWIESTCPLITQQAGMQALGSAITYARRYSLAAIVGVAAGEKEEDDGNGADKGQGRTRAQKQTREKKDPPASSGPKVQVESKPGDFIMPFGKTTKDKAIKDCDVGDLQKALAWLKEQPVEKLGKGDLAAKEALQAFFYELELGEARQ